MLVDNKLGDGSSLAEMRVHILILAVMVYWYFLISRKHRSPYVRSKSHRGCPCSVALCFHLLRGNTILENRSRSYHVPGFNAVPMRMPRRQGIQSAPASDCGKPAIETSLKALRDPYTRIV